MTGTSRGLREHVIRALAKVGLVWALALLGFVFTATAALGSQPDGGFTLASGGSATTHPASFTFVNVGETPRTAGLALALSVLVGGLAFLAVGSLRGTAEEDAGTRRDLRDDALPGDLPLALGLGLSPYASVVG